FCLVLGGTPPATRSRAASESSPSAGRGGNTRCTSVSVFSTTLTLTPGGTDAPAATKTALGSASSCALKAGSLHARATTLAYSVLSLLPIDVSSGSFGKTEHLSLMRGRPPPKPQFPVDPPNLANPPPPLAASHRLCRAPFAARG